MKNKGQAKLKKIGNMILNILLYVFLALAVLALAVTIFAKKGSDGTVELFGYQMRVVKSDSMEKSELADVSSYKIKSIPVRSMIFVQMVPQDEAEADEWYRALQVGDVLNFRYVYTTQETIAHRIISITEKSSGGFIIELAGDNKLVESGQLTQIIDTSIKESPNYVIGKVTGQAFLLGFIISLLQAPLGLIFIVIVPCFIIILLEVMKITGVLTSEKKQKEQEDAARKESELEELRRKVAELEGQAAAVPSEPEQKDEPKEDQSVN